MTSFKKIFKTVFGVGFAILTLASCQKEDTRNTNSDGATFYVDTVAGTFTSDSLDKGSLVNRKFINFTACLKDNALASAIMNLKFQISAGNVSIEKVTDERGCLVWQELFSYNPSGNEMQIPMTRSITALEGHSGTEIVGLVYNPWDSDKLVYTKREAPRSLEPVTVNYSLGTQITRLDPTTKENYVVAVDIATTAIDPTQQPLYISALSLQYMQRNFAKYEVDSALDLTVAHDYRVKFTAAFIRQTLSQGAIAVPINTGNYKIYFTLLNEGYDPEKCKDPTSRSYEPTKCQAQYLTNSIVSANEKDVSASMGRFIDDMTLQFNNVSALASRMTGVITILSLDDSDSYTESSFEGSLSPISGGTSQTGIDLIPSNLNARALLQQYQAAQTQQNSMTGLDLLESQSGYVNMSRDPVVLTFQSTVLKSETTTKVDLYALMKKIKTGQTLTSSEKVLFGQAICFQYFHGNPGFLMGTPGQKNPNDQCISNPDKYMAFTVREFVDKVNNPIPQQVGGPDDETLTVSAGLDFSNVSTKASGVANSRTFSLNADVGAAISGSGALLGVPLTGSLGAKFSVGRQWFTTSGVTKTANDSTKVSTARSIVVNSEAFKFALDVNVRTCLLIAPTQAMIDYMGGKAAPAGKYFCGLEDPRQTRNEVYYFLNESTGQSGSPLSDNLSSDDNPWRMFIRGTQTYTLFATLFAQKNVNLVLEKMPDADILKDFQEFYVTQEFPGMLTPQ